MTRAEVEAFTKWAKSIGKTLSSAKPLPLKAHKRWRFCCSILRRMELYKAGGLVPDLPSEWRWRFDALVRDARERERRALLLLWKEQLKEQRKAAKRKATLKTKKK